MRKPTVKSLKKRLWELCRQITFKRHGKNCYTCPQTYLTGMNCQCGHGYPDGALGVEMAYDLRILRPQCFQCNINHGGMGAVFWKRLEEDMGKEKADALFLECQASKGRPVRADILWYADKVKTYELILSAL